MKKFIILLIAIPVLLISCNTSPRGEVRDDDSGMRGRSYDDVRDRDRTDTEDRTDQPGIIRSDEEYDQSGTQSPQPGTQGGQSQRSGTGSQTDQSGTRSGQGTQSGQGARSGQGTQYDQTGTMRRSDTIRPDTSDAGGVGTIPR